jgi:peptidoglycan hydrolase-like protein with peptidoglycan-binding domain
VALQPPAREVAALASTVSRRLGNDKVREIQAKLEALGHDPGPVDGIFGPQTVSGRDISVTGDAAA